MRKLVFHFFITNDWRENKAYDIHFNCLNYYKECFDEVYFDLSTEDVSDIESLMEVKTKLYDIFRLTKKVTFEILENTSYGEVPTFKKEVVDRLGQDDLVFFAHTKGVTDVKRHHMDPEGVYNVICGLYYFSLVNARRDNGVMDEITNDLQISTDVISYGSFMTEFRYEAHLKNMYEWYYAGTFFWINSKRLKQYIHINRIETPEIIDRYYAENFLGNIYPIYFARNEESEGTTLACSYRQRYLFSDHANTVNLNHGIAFIIQGREDEFHSFLKEIKGYV